jgi:hypothetical protein
VFSSAECQGKQNQAQHQNRPASLQPDSVSYHESGALQQTPLPAGAEHCTTCSCCRPKIIHNSKGTSRQLPDPKEIDRSSKQPIWCAQHTCQDSCISNWPKTSAKGLPCDMPHLRKEMTCIQQRRPPCTETDTPQKGINCNRQTKQQCTPGF